MSLRLKMKLGSVTQNAAREPEMNTAYTLHAVYGTPENESWSKYTPSGTLMFTVTNPAAEKLKLGAEYFVTLDEVP